MKVSFGSVKLNVKGKESAADAPSEETPFRILVFGDFSGKDSRTTVLPGTKLGNLRPVAVDRDNFETVLGRLGVELHLPIDEPGLTLRFKEMDDFRPEKVFESVNLFEHLRQLREQLGDPKRFREAAEEVRGWTKEPERPTPAKAPEPAAPLPTGADLLDAVLGATQSSERSPTGPGGVDINALMKNIAAANMVRGADPREAELTGQVDEAISGLMRLLLHQPGFQGLESLWRGLFFLARRLDTDTHLKLFLLDVSRAELAADLASSDDLTATGIYRTLVEQTSTPGAPPWSLFVGNYRFGTGTADAETLGRMGQVASAAGAPFLAAASPALLGCRSLADDPDTWQPLDGEQRQAWDAVRALPEARYLGLILPRFLLRRPYGKDSEPVETFEFEEMAPNNAHEAYLWGNPAIAAAYLLGESFSQSRWSMEPGMLQEIDNLPTHVFDANGEAELKPCAEVLLTERAIDRIVEEGLMPLLSLYGRDAVQLARFHSLAADNRELMGRWRK